MGATICWFVNTMEKEAQETARGLRHGDPDLLDRLIQQYHYRLFRYLLMLTGNREAAEDLFQETWIRVLERGHQYNGKWRFEAWLFTIARNLAIDLLRRRQPQSLDALLDIHRNAIPLGLEAPGSPTPFDMASQSEDGEHLGAALGHLPPAYREVLLLRFQEDLELNEIAAVVGSPLPTVKSRLYRGLETLRELLEGGQA